MTANDAIAQVLQRGFEVHLQFRQSQHEYEMTVKSPDSEEALFICCAPTVDYLMADLHAELLYAGARDWERMDGRANSGPDAGVQHASREA